MKATGDCYEAAALYLMDHRNNPSLRLVHAEVAGQGPLQGMTLGHGWVEDIETHTVIDRSNGRDIRMPSMLYYAIGNVNGINNIHRYTFAEMRDRILGYVDCMNSGTFGPWDLEVRSYELQSEA